jgi:hypothetical protein
MKDAVAWMEQYRQFWEESLDRLGEYLKTVAAQKPPASKTSATTRKGRGRRDGRNK